MKIQPSINNSGTRSLGPYIKHMYICARTARPCTRLYVYRRSTYGDTCGKRFHRDHSITRKDRAIGNLRRVTSRTVYFWPGPCRIHKTVDRFARMSLPPSTYEPPLSGTYFMQTRVRRNLHYTRFDCMHHRPRD